jgi:transglutaminase-like putative cysteine protease
MLALAAAIPAGGAPPATAPAAPAQTKQENAPMQKKSLFLDAATLYQAGQVENLRLDDDHKALVLADWDLVEDDADGVGFPYSQDILAGETRIKKELVIEPAEANVARLLIYHAQEVLWKTPVYDARAAISVNGHAFEATLKPGWNSVPVEPAFLVRGNNEVVISTPAGGKPAVIPLADRDSILAAAPWRLAGAPRSFKSEGGGKTWSPLLGKGSDVRGEYMVRLHLQRHLAGGTYVSPVMDLADVDGQQKIKVPVEVRSLVATIRQESPAGTSATCSIRTGPTSVYRPAAWEEWRKLSDGARLGAKGRYFQVKIELATTDPLKTPSVSVVELGVEFEQRTLGGAGQLAVLEYKSYPVLRSSLPFEYESLSHPALKQLREQYHLDEVVQGAATQLERVVRLNHWLSTQWKWHAPEPIYPAWSALDILKKTAGGESQGGFCGQYAVAMTQCCLALGIQARYVFAGLNGVVGGHEVTEFWSDELGKWVLVDCNMDRYYLDPNNRQPMNAMEVHRAILRHYFDGDAIGDDAHNKARFDAKGLEGFLKQGPQAQHGGNVAGPNWFDPVKAHLMWGHPHMMRRNNFFAKPQPLPKQHGFGIPWSWNGYYHWFDAQSPREELFTGYTDRLCDYYWNLNQVDLLLEQTPEPGVLAVSADTNTPDLAALLVSIDGGAWTPTSDTFAWRLKEGENSLQVKVRNTSGVEGKASVARVSWSAK